MWENGYINYRTLPYFIAVSSSSTHKDEEKILHFAQVQSEKQTFLKEHGDRYGYNGRIDQIREEEYPQLKSMMI